MKIHLQRFFCLLMLALPLFAFAPQQVEKSENGKIKITERDYNNSEVEMADVWRENGKIYVVVATVTTLLMGIFAYLFMMDKKIHKLEKQFENS